MNPRRPRPHTLLSALAAALLLLDLALHLRHSLQPPSLPLVKAYAKRAAASPSAQEFLAAARAVAAEHASLILSFGRDEQRELLSNFLATAAAAGLRERLLLVSLDDASHQLALRHGAASHRARAAELLDADDAAAVATPRRLVARLYAARWRYAALLTQAGLSVWLSDVRVLWLRSPFAAAVRLPAECELALVAAEGAEEGGAGVSLALSFHAAAEGVGRFQLAMADAVGRIERAEGEELSRQLRGCAAGGAGCVRWCELPRAHFANGVQYFQHRVPAAALSGVLADGVPAATLPYRLREEGLWRQREPPADAEERFLAFKELVIDNGLSNTRGALRSALAIATLTNRTLILPPFWSRHLHGEPYRVGADYYFDWPRLRAAFPRVREAAFLGRAFPGAAEWPPRAPLRVFFVQLSAGETLCGESHDSSLMEARGKVNATCPPLAVEPSRLHTHLAAGFHLGATDAELLTWLAPFHAEPLLFFGRMFRRFWRFTSPRDHAAFVERFEQGVQPAPEIRAAAAATLRALRAATAPAAAFNCVHMRRRDFLADHEGEEVSVREYARKARLRLHAAELPLFLASDVAEDPAVKREFGAHFPRVITLLDVFPRRELDAFGSAPLSQLPPEERHAALARDMRFGNVDQLVCSQAEHFVGNKWSSFTHHVCHLREQRVDGACRDSDIYGRGIDPRMEYI
ncbi:hypothetical protein AB1Y20_005233 [Prymnesium parvum]|uniref:GDP-fucose protein O-fucosyltransferase 2 n=1 Tax=Prymnesium parvum TaxID=97485 RepID=A0AB34J351_PRYPA